MLSVSFVMDQVHDKHVQGSLADSKTSDEHPAQAATVLVQIQKNQLFFCSEQEAGEHI